MQKLATTDAPAVTLAVLQVAQLPEQALDEVPLFISHQALHAPVLGSAETQARHWRDEPDEQLCQAPQVVMACAGSER